MAKEKTMLLILKMKKDPCKGKQMQILKNNFHEFEKIQFENSNKLKLQNENSTLLYIKNVM